VVACRIVILDSETHSDRIPALLYITLLLMPAKLFSITPGHHCHAENL